MHSGVGLVCFSLTSQTETVLAGLTPPTWGSKLNKTSAQCLFSVSFHNPETEVTLKMTSDQFHKVSSGISRRHWSGVLATGGK